MRLLISILLVLCVHHACIAVLVTKNMGKPSRPVPDLSALHMPGVEYLKKNGGVAPQQLSPVVCIPGVGGNQLYARLNKTNSNHWFCDKKEDWYMIWLPLSELLPGPFIDCWTNNIELQYNETTGQFLNATGVDVETYGGNTTLGFEYLDPSSKKETIYFASIVQSLLAVGYQRGVNIFGASFDWRLAPNSMPEYFPQLQNLIETTYRSNNNSKVSIVAHSMGNLLFMCLLQSLPQEWKDTYIKSYVAVSPPWTGAVEALQSLASGYDFSIPYLFPNSARGVQRSFESNYFLLPRPDIWGDYVAVETNTRNYTINDYADFFHDISMPDAYNVWKRTSNLFDPSIPPNIDTYCFYGHGVKTHVELEYMSGFQKQPKAIIGDGDGTVPLQSLTYCETWQNKMPNKLMVKGYDNQEHVDLLMDKDMLQDMLSAILGV